MKILLLRNTLASGRHLEAGSVQDVSDDDGALLIRLGRATLVLPEAKPTRKAKPAEPA